MRTPSRASRSTRSSKPSSGSTTGNAVVGSGARNAADAPAAITRGCSVGASSGELGRERAVGHADDGRTGDVDARAERVGHQRDHSIGERLVSTEVARRPACRERDASGTRDLDARRERVERDGDGLEGTSVSRGIGGNDHEARTSPLCFTAAQAELDSLEPGRRRRRDDSVRVHDRKRLVGHRARGDDRPLGTAQHQRAHRRRYPASARTNGVTGVTSAQVAITPSGPGNQSDVGARSRRAPPPRCGDRHSPRLQVAGSVLDTRPPRVGDRAAHVDGQRARGADDEQHCTALTRPCGQAPRVAHRDSLRRAHEHDVDRIDERGDDRRPLTALGSGHDREALERDATLSRRAEAEPRHADGRDPRSLLRRPGGEGEGQRGDPALAVDRDRRAPHEAVREQRRERRDDRHHLLASERDRTARARRSFR